MPEWFRTSGLGRVPGRGGWRVTLVVSGSCRVCETDRRWRERTVWNRDPQSRHRTDTCVFVDLHDVVLCVGNQPLAFGSDRSHRSRGPEPRRRGGRCGRGWRGEPRDTGPTPRQFRSWTTRPGSSGRGRRVPALPYDRTWTVRTPQAADTNVWVLGEGSRVPGLVSPGPFLDRRPFLSSD